MTWNLKGTHAQEGDIAELVGLSHKHFIITLKADGELHTHRGVVYHNDLIGLPWGSELLSHTGAPFYLLQPALGDLLKETPRNTQIMYPKEIGYILVNMGIGPGMHVLEAGTGSGSLTTAFAYAVGENGRVTSYEARPEMQNLARKNLTRIGLADRVDFKLGNISDGFEESNVDALFLDVPNPYDYMAQVRKALKLGGFFGCILPTANQISRLLPELRRYQFSFVDVCEILIRFYKPEPDRFRPVDRMIAHTGYLIFGRPIIKLARENEEVDEDLSQDILEDDASEE